jgi:hypothetical protein
MRLRWKHVLLVSASVLLGLAGTGVAAGDLQVEPVQTQPTLSVEPSPPPPTVTVAPAPPPPTVTVAPPTPPPNVTVQPPEAQPPVAVTTTPAPTASTDPQAQNVNPQAAATATPAVPTPADTAAQSAPQATPDPQATSSPQATTDPQATAGSSTPPPSQADAQSTPDVPLQGGPSTDQVQGQSPAPIQGGPKDAGERLQHANPGHALEGNRAGGGTAGATNGGGGGTAHLPSGDTVNDARGAINTGAQERKTRTSQRLRDRVSAAGGNGLKNAAKVASFTQVLGLGAGTYGAYQDFTGDQKGGHSKLSSAGYTTARVAGGVRGAAIAATLCIPAGAATLGAAEVACTAAGSLTGEWVGGWTYKAARGDGDKKKNTDPRKDMPHVLVLPLL